jgi:hypothetical protein
MVLSKKKDGMRATFAEKHMVSKNFLNKSTKYTRKHV